MAYDPGFDEIPGENNNPASQDSGSYEPSYQDIPDEQTGNNQPAAQQLEQMANKQGAKPFSLKDYANNLITSNQLVNPLDVINAAVSGLSPKSVAQMIAPGIGKILSIAQPELMETPGLLSGLVNTAGRLGAGTASMTMQDAPNINSQQDLKNSIMNNLGFNAAIESIPASFRAVGGASELMNPSKFVNYKANEIKQGFDQVSQLRSAAYAPINDKYDNQLLTSNPKQYFDFNKDEKKYFTPNVKKVLDTFHDEPSFKNASILRTQLGVDAAKISGNSAKINQYQALSNARDKVVNNQRNYLSNDQPMLNQFDNAQKISRDLYFPYLSSNLLKDISKGNMTNVTGNKLVKDINYNSSGDNPTIPQNHPLKQISDSIQDKINRSRFMQSAIPVATGLAGADYANSQGESPLLGGALGASSGLGSAVAMKMLEPYFSGIAQNPWLVKHLSNLSPLYYGATREGIQYNKQ